MPKQPIFTVYNASAGSGKTFTLVKAFLKIALEQPRPDYYRHILAITFTNKAVAEMKSRLLEALAYFTNPTKSETKLKPLFKAVLEASGLTPDTLSNRAAAMHKHLLHHYSDLSIETIDSFNYRLIKTFARELKLPSDVQPYVDIPLLQRETVETLIESVGSDATITKQITALMHEKLSRGENWNASTEILKLLDEASKEQHTQHVDALLTNSDEAFDRFIDSLQQIKTSLGQDITKNATNALYTIHQNGLEASHFTRKLLYNHFKSLNALRYTSFTAKWHDTLEKAPLYKKTNDFSASVIEALNRIKPDLLKYYTLTKAAYFDYLLVENVLKTWKIVVLYRASKKIWESLKEANGYLPISEFNALINKEIKNQPAPYLYERLGNRYHHFFIDEFQDTSQMQWQNLIPLIDNSLAQETNPTKAGSAFIVGDAKQSIYRWRGGAPEQFLSLTTGASPFKMAEKQTPTLTKNYRSTREIVAFNNTFFEYAARFLKQPKHQKLFQESVFQTPTVKGKGFVKIDYVEQKDQADEWQERAVKIYWYIQRCIRIDKSYELNDICILVRRNDFGSFLAAFLIDKGLKIFSTDNLLLKEDRRIQFIINTLHWCTEGQSKWYYAKMLQFLHGQSTTDLPLPDFISTYLDKSIHELGNAWQPAPVSFQIDTFKTLPLFESISYLLHAWNLNTQADAYLFDFMEFVWKCTQKGIYSFHQFLEEWQRVKDNLKTTLSESQDAIKILTIHKAKGLQFPIVIYAFKADKLTPNSGELLWLDWNKTQNISTVLAKYDSNMPIYSKAAAAYYKKRIEEIQLDNLNLLYVAFTRAQKGLYLLPSYKPRPPVEEPTTTTEIIREFLIQHPKWRAKCTSSVIIAKKLTKKEKSKQTPVLVDTRFMTTHFNNFKKLKPQSNLEASQKEAVKWGLLLHEVMAKITSYSDFETLYNNTMFWKQFPENLSQEIKRVVLKIVNHPQLITYFKTPEECHIERDIITQTGEILRPDRLHLYKDNTALIIDYKTGIKTQKDTQQINKYRMALEVMQYKVKACLIVYVSQDQIECIKV